MATITLFNRTPKNQGKMLAKVAAGAAAAGAVGALMFTPKTGKEMRGKVASKARMIGDKASKMTQKGKDGKEELLKKTSDAALNIAETADSARSGSSESGSSSGGTKNSSNGSSRSSS